MISGPQFKRTALKTKKMCYKYAKLNQNLYFRQFLSCYLTAQMQLAGRVFETPALLSLLMHFYSSQVLTEKFDNIFFEYGKLTYLEFFTSLNCILQDLTLVGESLEI
jgi:hypothetical protein